MPDESSNLIAFQFLDLAEFYRRSQEFEHIIVRLNPLSMRVLIAILARKYSSMSYILVSYLSKQNGSVYLLVSTTFGVHRILILPPITVTFEDPPFGPLDPGANFLLCFSLVFLVCVELVIFRGDLSLAVLFLLQGSFNTPSSLQSIFTSKRYNNR